MWVKISEWFIYINVKDYSKNFGNINYAIIEDCRDHNKFEIHAMITKMRYPKG